MTFAEAGQFVLVNMDKTLVFDDVFNLLPPKTSFKALGYYLLKLDNVDYSGTERSGIESQSYDIPGFVKQHFGDSIHLTRIWKNGYYDDIMSYYIYLGLTMNESTNNAAGYMLKISIAKNDRKMMNRLFK